MDWRLAPCGSNSWSLFFLKFNRPNFTVGYLHTCSSKDVNTVKCNVFATMASLASRARPGALLVAALAVSLVAESSANSVKVDGARVVDQVGRGCIPCTGNISEAETLPSSIICDMAHD